MSSTATEKQKGAYVDPAPSSSSVALPANEISAGDEDSVWRVKIESIREQVEQARRENEVHRWERVCIYRIPARLRASADKGLYTPLTVSIGPYHYSNHTLWEMTQHKWRALQYMLKRTKQDVNLYIDSMRQLEGAARACYEGQLDDFASTEFVEMLMLDGCFMLECFYGSRNGFTDTVYGSTLAFYEPTDPVFSLNSTIMSSIRQDMLMLENQLPLLVLKQLVELQMEGSPLPFPREEWSLRQLALKFFEPLMPTYGFEKFKTVYGEVNDGIHCLDLIRQEILQGDNALTITRIDLRMWNLDLMKKTGVDKWKPSVPKWKPSVPCVTELIEAGIKLKMRKGAKFWRVTYKDGEIHMPQIAINGIIKSLFFNLMAFEQCHTSKIKVKNWYITAYVAFLDMLIDTAKDVSYLRSRNILEHHCGSDAEAARQIDLLSEGVISHFPGYLGPLYLEVDHYCNRKWNLWRTILKRRYFTNPWTIISLAAAVVLLLLTFGQTFYNIYAYYRPSGS